MAERLTHCPHCDADLNGGTIPEEIREHYRPPYRWGRQIAIVIDDFVREYQCPDCGNRWPRDFAPAGRQALRGGKDA